MATQQEIDRLKSALRGSQGLERKRLKTQLESAQQAMAGGRPRPDKARIDAANARKNIDSSAMVKQAQEAAKKLMDQARAGVKGAKGGTQAEKDAARAFNNAVVTAASGDIFYNKTTGQFKDRQGNVVSLPGFSPQQGRDFVPAPTVATPENPLITRKAGTTEAPVGAIGPQSLNQPVPGVTGSVPDAMPGVTAPPMPTGATTETPTVFQQPLGGTDTNQTLIDIAMKRYKGEDLTDEEVRFLIEQQLTPPDTTAQREAIAETAQATTGQIEELRDEQAATRAALLEEKQALSEKQLERAGGIIQKGADLEIRAGQNTYSFNGFGRSTEAALNAQLIQENANQRLESLIDATNLEEQLFLRELQGADEESLQPLKDQLSTLRQNALELDLQNIQAVKSGNALAGVNGVEAINNILEILPKPQSREVDVDTSKLVGYLSDSQGNEIMDPSGNPIPIELDEEEKTKYQSQFNPVTGEQIIFDPGSGKVIQKIDPFGNVSVGEGALPSTAPTQNGYTAAQGMRTDRHNNPTAMTSDVARTLGLQEGVDYTVGDPFPDNPSLFTARLTGDPVETTIKALDTAANSADKSAFYTQGGKPRWSYTAISDEQWLSFSNQEKRDFIKGMYQVEGGNGSLFGESVDFEKDTVSVEDYLIEKSNGNMKDYLVLKELIDRNGGEIPKAWIEEKTSKLTSEVLKDPAYKEAIEVKAGYDTAISGAKQQNGPGDVAMVNGYQRMIDPGATVRGEDIKTQAQAQAFIQRTFNVPGKIFEGTRFTPKAREVMIRAIVDQYNNKLKNWNDNARIRFEERASNIGVPIEAIVDSFPPATYNVFGDVLFDPNADTIRPEDYDIPADIQEEINNGMYTLEEAIDAKLIKLK